MTQPAYFEYGNRLKIIGGANTLQELPSLLRAVSASCLMLISDPEVVASGGLDLVHENLGSTAALGPVVQVVPVNSDMSIVQRAAKLFNESHCDAIVAVGGGSVIDTAKVVNILALEGASDAVQLAGYNVLRRPLHPLIVIPTTAGSGSEATCTAVIADPESHRNFFFTSPFVMPLATIIDPRMTLSLPIEITAAGAMSALSHAVEAYICMADNPLSRANAISAIDLIRANLIAVMRSPRDVSGRMALATASCLAGMATSNGMTGMVSALAHGLSVLCQVPYSLCAAILLPYGLEYNLDKIESSAGELLPHVAGSNLFAKTPRHLRADQLIKTVREINRKLCEMTNGKHAVSFKDMIDSFGRPKIPQDIFNAAATAALNDYALFFNPEKIGRSELVRVLEHAWEGRPIEKISSK